MARALDILECVAASPTPLRSSEIAARVGLQVTTASNLLRTLYYRGYLGQTSDRRYRTGVEALRLATHADRWHVLRELSTPILADLSAATGDASFLGVLQDGRLVCVAQTQGTGAVIVTPGQCWFDELHSTATGKVLLAALDAATRAALLPPELAALTDKTITDKSRFDAELRAVHSRGHAVSDEESRPGVASLGVPVHDQRGVCIAALAQTFPSYFLQSGHLDPELRAMQLHSAAAAISTVLQEGPSC